MFKGISMIASLSLLCTVGASAQQQTSMFGITVNNYPYDNDAVNRPHRTPASHEGVAGAYDYTTGTLSLEAPFDIACVRIYKDNALIMEDGYPLTEDGTVCYNLSFYSSGAYRVCIYHEEGNAYISYLNV